MVSPNGTGEGFRHRGIVIPQSVLRIRHDHGLRSKERLDQSGRYLVRRREQCGTE
jgi:hypothetical protein